ncbi:MAG: lysostaphin resistance A-like protein [Pseudonocardia sp.]
MHDGEGYPRRPGEGPTAAPYGPPPPVHGSWPGAQGPLPPHGPPVGPPRRPGLAGLAAPVPRRTHAWGLPAFLLVEAVFLLVSVAVGAAVVDGAALDSRLPAFTVGGFALVTVVPTVAAAALALWITRLRGAGPRVDLGLVWSWRDVGIGLGLGFAGLFLSGVAAAVWVSIVGPDVSSAVGEALAGLRASWPVALAIMFAVVVVAPVCEEILYRGLLWGAVEKLGAGPWLAFAITTVVFAFAHFELLRAPLLLVIAIPIGFARLLTGRLAASIVAHAFNNLLPGVAVFLLLVGVELPAPA